MVRVLVCLTAALTLGQVAAPPSSRQPARGREQTDHGRITGRVTDAAGHAVSGVFVSVLEEGERDTHGAPPLHPVSVRLFSVTDARGEFVLESLRSGGYCVVAIPRNTSVTADNRPNRSGYAITFYPGTSKAADAKSIVVARDATVTANITLAAARLSVIAGSVTDSSGRPARSARLLIALGDGLFGLDGTATTTRPDGTFALSGLPPATYYLHLREGVWPPPRDVIPKVSTAKVIVSDRDITDVRVLPTPMVRASGRVLVDPADRPSLQPSAITVGATPVDTNGNPGPTR